MSVVGFDIGNFKSSVGVARAGGIEIVANEYSDRITPTYVAFTNNERFQGHSAKQQEITNHQNTISCFKRLLGRKLNDPQVQNEKTFQPLRVVQSQNGDEKLLFNVDYLNETKQFTVEQITAMFMTKLKSIGEMNLNTKVVDCVMTVPSYMTDAERRAILDACQIAGLNCLKLMNDTTAVALTYGLYHSALPELTEKPHIVVFVDIGYTQVQASAVAFNKGKLRMLATTFDNNLGGRDFDRVLCDHFQTEFKQKYKVDAYSNIRAKLRLRAECEKLKKLMSSNSSPIPLNIECFMDDIDVSGKMKRDEFEKLSESLLARVKKTLSELLTEAKLNPEEIDLVEIVGGSTRIPAVKQIVQEVFAKEPSTTLNSDEACARGATIMCAILSPTFKVKEFKIEECQLFPITLNWKGAETDDNELEVFPHFEKIPLSKLLTIYKREPFEIEARYRYPNNIPYNDPRIGKFLIGNITPNAQGENSEVKLKARITKNGIFEISSPQIIETIEVQPQPAAVQEESQENKPQQNGNGPVVQEQANESTDTASNIDEMAVNDEQSNGAQADATQTPAQQTNVKKKKTKAVDLPLTAKVPQLSKNEINFFIEQELSMIQQDKKEKERSEAKNSVEEYIYEIREKLSSEYERFILPENKEVFLKSLDETENWLYTDDAADQEKSVYVDRLQHLKNSVHKILPKHIVATILKATNTNESTKPRSPTVPTPKLKLNSPVSAKSNNDTSNQPKLAHSRQENLKNQSQYSIKNLNKISDFITTGSPKTKATTNITAKNPLKSDSTKLLLNKNNYNDPTNVTNIKPAINQMHTAAPTMNYSYPGSSMMYPHLAGLSSSNPYYSYLNQQQQQQPQLYPYQQQQSTMYNYPQQYAGLQQQFSSQPDVNKRYHF